MQQLEELFSLPPEQRLQWVRDTPVDQLLAWLLELVELKSRSKAYGKKYRTKQQMLVKAAMQFLSPDELEEVARRAQEKADGL